MIFVSTFLLLTLHASAQSSQCNLSSPSGFLVVPLMNGPSSQAASCSQYNMVPATLNNDNVNEASDAIFNCKGWGAEALISKWNGSTYGSNCLTAQVSYSVPGLAIHVSPACHQVQSVLCLAKRFSEPEITPTVTVTSSTTLTASTTTETVQVTVTVPFEPLPLPLNAVISTDGLYVLIPDDQLVLGTEDALCAKYGMQLAFLGSASYDGFSTYMSGLGTSSSFAIQNLVPNSFLYSAIQVSKVNVGAAGTIVITTKLAHFSSGASFTVSGYPLCYYVQYIPESRTTLQIYSAYNLPVFSNAAALAACNSSGKALANYPTWGNEPVINGLVNGFNSIPMITDLQMPVASNSTFLHRNGETGEISTVMASDLLKAEELYSFNGAICAYPQL